MDKTQCSEKSHHFYGAATVGERGQVVIPAEARRDLGIIQGTKLLVFRGGPDGGELMLAKAENMAEMLEKSKWMMSQLEEMLKKESQESENNG